MKNTNIMIDYSKSMIYKIVSNDENALIYIGSTTKKYLSQRMMKHRSSYKLWKKHKASKVMAYNLFETYGIENCKIILLEVTHCTSKDELRRREQHYIDTTNCNNKHNAIRTIENMKRYKCECCGYHSYSSWKMMRHKKTKIHEANLMSRIDNWLLINRK